MLSLDVTSDESVEAAVRELMRLEEVMTTADPPHVVATSCSKRPAHRAQSFDTPQAGSQTDFTCCADLRLLA